MNTKTTQGSKSYFDLDTTKEAEENRIIVSAIADGEHSTNT